MSPHGSENLEKSGNIHKNKKLRSRHHDGLFLCDLDFSHFRHDFA